MKFIMKYNNIIKTLLENVKTLHYEFKCTDADEDGVFEYTPWGSIDTNEFQQFISHMEEHEIDKDTFNSLFTLPSLFKDTNELYYYFDGRWCVIFDGDTHFVYSVI
jgi:hypothetical protein